MYQFWNKRNLCPIELQVCENFIPPLLEIVLAYYMKNIPAAREPEVLSTMATIINKLEVTQVFSRYTTFSEHGEFFVIGLSR